MATPKTIRGFESLVKTLEERIARQDAKLAGIEEKHADVLAKSRDETKEANAKTSAAALKLTCMWHLWDAAADVLRAASRELQTWYSTASVMKTKQPERFTDRGFVRTASIRKSIREVKARAKLMRAAGSAEELEKLLSEPNPDATTDEVI